jgi:choline dehydrogenase-like flavoprotein
MTAISEGNHGPTDNIVREPAECLRTEIAVIGSGPGGAITACLLAEAGRDVLLVEEGPFLPLESCVPFTREEMVQKYRNGGVTVAMGSPKVAYVEGRCVGGGSEINSGLYHRAPPEVLDQWRAEFQVAGLTEGELLPHFEANERDLSVSLLPGAAPAASLKLCEGAAQLGWKCLEVPRWFKYETKPLRAESDGGTRQSMSKTFIPRFLAAGGKLLPETRIRTLRNAAGSWRLTGLHNASKSGSQHTEIEAGKVFVCGGAIQTPALLRRSGITRNVGNSLRLHATVKIVARFFEEVNPQDMGVPVHQVKEFAPRFSFGCSISSLPYLSLAMADHPEHLPEIDRHWPRMAIYYAMIRGGRGSVRNVPFFRDPMVRYRMGAEDLSELTEALRRLGQCLFAAGAEALYPSVAGWPRWTRPSDLDGLPASLPATRANLMTIHLCGTCPMGETPARCAADSFGKVYGAEGLYLADASLLCSAPTVNPQGSIMAIARRNVLQFLGAN